MTNAQAVYDGTRRCGMTVRLRGQATQRRRRMEIRDHAGIERWRTRRRCATSNRIAYRYAVRRGVGRAVRGVHLPGTGARLPQGARAVLRVPRLRLGRARAKHDCDMDRHAAGVWTRVLRDPGSTAAPRRPSVPRTARGAGVHACDEYDQLIEDPTGFLYNVWLPRVPGRCAMARHTCQHNLALSKASWP